MSEPYVPYPVTKDTTQNIRCTKYEKARWKRVAPNGNVSEWLRELANKAMMGR